MIIEWSTRSPLPARTRWSRPTQVHLLSSLIGRHRLAPTATRPACRPRWAERRAAGRPGHRLRAAARTSMTWPPWARCAARRSGRAPRGWACGRDRQPAGLSSTAIARSSRRYQRCARSPTTWIDVIQTTNNPGNLAGCSPFFDCEDCVNDADRPGRRHRAGGRHDMTCRRTGGMACAPGLHRSRRSDYISRPMATVVEQRSAGDRH